MKIIHHTKANTTRTQLRFLGIKGVEIVDTGPVATFSVELPGQKVPIRSHSSDLLIKVTRGTIHTEFYDEPSMRPRHTDITYEGQTLRIPGRTPYHARSMRSDVTYETSSTCSDVTIHERPT